MATVSCHQVQVVNCASLKSRFLSLVEAPSGKMVEGKGPQYASVMFASCASICKHFLVTATTKVFKGS